MPIETASSPAEATMSPYLEQWACIEGKHWARKRKDALIVFFIRVIRYDAIVYII